MALDELDERGRTQSWAAVTTVAPADSALDRVTTKPMTWAKGAIATMGVARAELQRGAHLPHGGHEVAHGSA